MRVSNCVIIALLALAAGCQPNETDLAERERPGSVDDDSGTDRPPTGDSSENAAPPLRPSRNNPSNPVTPPR